MPGNVLLDTNAAIGLLNGDQALTTVLAATATGIYLPAAVVGELYFGAFNSGRVSGNVAKLEAFLTANTVLNSDAETGRRYGQIKFDLRRAGRPIPDNDLWIAACAVQYGLLLATRDAHFQHVAGLSTIAW
jgi:tRNA(fMet)-specific endonuclease VapC